MIARIFSLQGRWIVLVLWILGGTTPAAPGQTPLPGGTASVAGKRFEIRLLPGFTHRPLQGIDSIVGKIVKKDGLEIQYEMGGIPAPGAFRLGGHFVNQALQLPARDRLWLREQNAGGRKVHVAYSRKHRLIVSTASLTEGVNFAAVAKTPGDVADVLLMVLTLVEQKPRPDK